MRLIICGLLPWAPPAFFSQANSGFSFEEESLRPLCALYLTLDARVLSKNNSRSRGLESTRPFRCVFGHHLANSAVSFSSRDLTVNFFHTVRPDGPFIYGPRTLSLPHKNHNCAKNCSLPCRPLVPGHFWDRETANARNLHQAIILDVPTSRSPLNKKISMRLHRR